LLKKIAPLALAIGVATPALAKTHKFNYSQPCNVLWPAVKDTLRNSGKYGIIGISNEELTASYNIGGFLTGKRINSLVLNTIPTGCELQVQTSYSGLVNDDVDALKKRVDESLTKLGSTAQPPAKPVESPQP
jgi:hypothetical protein